MSVCKFHLLSAILDTLLEHYAHVLKYMCLYASILDYFTG